MYEAATREANNGRGIHRVSFFFLLFEYTPYLPLLPIICRPSRYLFIAYNYTMCFDVFYLKNTTLHGSPLVLSKR
ncbi:hypothetical protein ARMGADRAFT_212050 [Armillaria gallica]|uniref:Uncharacterized protein n=1 Tax=Armillaria gallica TaxID=47427 RepID=A0A2H3DTN6_ARMGA|nr:hypothetical protein ARMGADRAFT_212050 [Armillaria gallica]